MTARDEDLRQTLLVAVARIRPEIERASADGEAAMTLPTSSVSLLADAGLLRMKLPKDLGGLEADLITQYEVVEAMAYADAAAGWCLMIGATCIALPGAFLPDAAIEEVFRSSRVPLAAAAVAPSGQVTPSEGGYILRGRWPFASGVRHSDWLTVGGLVPDDRSDRPRHLMFVLPTSGAHIEDNWDTIGLRGTGSCDVTLRDVFVPTAFSFDLLTGEPARGGPLYRLGMPALVAYEHVAFAVGVARRAIDTLIALAPSKRRGIPPSPLIERGAFQRDLGELNLRLWAARALALERNWEAWRRVTGGERLDNRMQAELRAVATFATDVALGVVLQAYRYAGGSVVYKPNVLERALRDLQTASQHLMVSSSAYEILGEALLGVSGIQPLS